MRRAFTLVEILIVVIILGILAAIVIPQFTNASSEAASSSTLSQLRTIRSQLELYRIRHSGTWPSLGTVGDITDWDPIVHPSDERAYLQGAPYNSFTSKYGIGTEESVDVGWVWDAVTGDIRAPYFDELTATFTAPGS